SYTDYSCWAKDRKLEKERAYWNQVFEEPAQVLELPTDAGRGRLRDSQGGRVSRTLPESVRENIKDYCQSHGMTEYMVLLGGLMVLLGAYSGQEDITVGTVAAGRTRRETEEVIGMFANTLVMRGYPEKEKQVKAFFEEIRETGIKGYENQEYPYWRLAEEKGGKRELSRNPLFDVMLVLQDGEAMEYRLNGVESSLEADGAGEVQFELTFQIKRNEKEEEVSLEYSRELYQEETARWMLEHYVECLGWMLEHPEEPLGKVELAGEEEKKKILQEFNYTEKKCFQERNIVELFEKQVSLYPKKQAVSFQNHTVSYEELDQWSDYIAVLLQEKGVEKGDRVALIIERGIKAIVGILGIEKAGGVYLPVEPEVPEDRCLYMLQDSQVKAILTEETQKLTYLPDHFMRIAVPEKDSRREQCKVRPVIIEQDNPAYIIYTSGTTGKPKGVLVNHRGLVNLAYYFVSDLEISDTDSILQFASLMFDASVWEITMALLTGADLVILPERIKLDIQRTEAYLKEHHVTVATLPPNYYSQMQDTKLQLVITAGSRTDKNIVEKSAGKRYVNAYGPTETTVCATHWERDGSTIPENIPIGRPILNSQVYILQNDKLCGIGIPGELCIAGEGVAQEYIQKEELTREKFAENPFGEGRMYRSGDLARWLPDGNIEFLGRIDEQVKIRGYRIEPGEIESALCQIPSITDAAVIVIEEENGDKEICGYLVSPEKLNITNIKEILAKSLPVYMIPAYMMQIEKIPVTRSGKVDKRALPEVQKARKEQYTAPETEEEILLCQLLEEILRADQVGVQDNFFELGGDSIKAIRLVSKVREKKYELSVKDMIEQYTVKNIAAKMKPLLKWEVKQSEVTGMVPKIPVMKEFLKWKLEKPEHFNQEVLLENVSYTEEEIREVLRELAVHHDMLRLVKRDKDFEILSVEKSQLYQLRCITITEKNIWTEMEKHCNDVQSGIDLEQGPLLHAILFDTPEGRYVFICIHHLAVDGVSWNILLDDWELAINQLRSKKRIQLPPKTTSFIEWGNELQKYALQIGVDEKKYWENIIEQIPEASVKAVFGEDKGTGEVNLSLSKEETENLIKFTRLPYHTEVNDILLAALGRAFYKMTGQNKIAVELERHGREEIGKNIRLDRTVGWFTNLVPVILRSDENIGDSIASVKDMLKTIPHNGIGAGILRENLPDFKPAVYFNYMGERSGDDRQKVKVRYAFGRSIAEENKLPGDISLNGEVYNHCLIFSVKYDKKYGDDWIQKWTACYKDSIQELVIFCMEQKEPIKTCSDFLLAGIQKEDLKLLYNHTKNIGKIDNIYPLTSLQQGMLYAKIMNSSASDYVVQKVYHITGTCYPDYIPDVLHALCCKYEVLKSAFCYQKIKEPCQIIFEERQMEFLWEDYTGKLDKETAFHQMLKEDIDRGFDLEQDSLLRVKMIKFSNRCYHMVISFHHIILDGWSIALVYSDFWKYYKMLVKGYSAEQVHQLAKDEALPYEDYIRWMLKTDKAGAAAYWSKVLKEYDGNAEIKPAGLQLETLEKVSRRKQRIAKETVWNLKKISKENHVTINSAVELAWGILLQKYNKSKDVVFGKVVSGRNAEVENMDYRAGLFINTVVTRAVVSETDTVADLMKKIQKQSSEGSSYDYCSLADIMSYAGNGRNLVKTLFVFENYYSEESKEWQEAGLSVDADPAREKTNYDITVTISDQETFLVEVLYNPAVYTEEEIDLVLQRYERILEVIPASLNCMVTELDVLTDKEKQLVLKEFNQTYRPWPKEQTVTELLEQQVEKTPNKTAVVYHEKSLTYEELNEKSERFATFLKNRGVGKGDFIAVMAEKSLEVVVAICGIMKAGAAYIPIDVSYPAERIQYILGDSQPKFLIWKEACHIETDIPYIVLTDQSIWEEEGEWTENKSHPSDLAYVIYTSGTTGTPKGVMVEHKNIVKLVMNADYTVMDTHSVVLQTGALAFDASTYEIWGTFLNGGELHLIDDKILLHVKKLKEYIVSNKINTMFLTTALFNQMLNFDETMFDTLEHLMFGGEKTAEKQVVLLQEKKRPVDFRNVYGPTETTTFAAHYRIQEQKRYKTPIGRPIANTQAYILNDRQLCGICMPGELCIGGDGVSRGYLNRPDLTQSKFLKNPFGEGNLYCSGDLARWLPDGNIEYLGRLDDQVKVRGFRIELGEIQSRLRNLSNISDAVVILKEEESGDKQILAFFVAEEELDISEIRRQLSAKMPEYMIPTGIMQIKEIPVTQNGKVDKGKLLAEKISSISEREYIPPEDELEETVCSIFELVLGVERIGIKDDFYRMGGHSLKAIQLVNQIEQQTGYLLEISDILENSTVQQLAVFMKDRDKTKQQPLAKADEKPEYAMTEVQRRMYMLQCASPDSIHYNMPDCLEIIGQFNEKKLKETFQKLVQRHSALRTTFHIADGKWIQKIHKSAELSIPTKHITGGVEEAFRNFVRPFHLSEELPIRVEIVLEKDRSWLFVDIHHIAADGSSISILKREFEQLYNDNPIPDPSRQFIDYSQWLLTQNYEKQKSYWKTVFEKDVKPVELPYDYRKKKNERNLGSTERYRLSKEIYQSVSTLAKKERVTANMIFLSAVSVLLSKYSGEEDVVIGCPVMARNHKDADNIVGMFVNTVPVRLYPSAKQSFQDYLTEVKQRAVEAYKNRDCSLEDIIPEKYVERDSMQNPLFQVAVIYQNLEPYSYRGNGFVCRQTPVDTGIYKFDLSFEIIEEEADYQIALNYNRSLFEKETARRILEELEQVVFQCLKNPESELAGIDVLTRQERQKVLEDFNQTRALYDTSLSYLDMLEERMQKTPDKTALVWKEQKISFRELDRLSQKIAQYIRSNSVKKEDICAIMVTPSAEMFIGAIGIMRAGCAYMPVDSNYPEERIKYMLEKSNAVLILTEQQFADREEFRGRKTGIIKDILKENQKQGQEKAEKVYPDNLAYVIFTSGSTGKPKGVMIEHKALVNMVHWHNRYFGLTEEDRSIKYAGFGFDASVHEMYPQLIAGVEIHIIPEEIRMDMVKLRKYVEDNKITIGFMPTPICEQFMKKECRALRMMITGGDKLRSFCDWYTLYNNYGPTENTVVSTVFQVDRFYENIPIGRPIDNVCVYVLDKNLKPVPIGIPGELMISGSGLARGYLNDEKLTEERFIDNPYIPGTKMYRTGDVVRWLTDGNLEFLGRNDEQIKIRGNRVEAGEIENAAKQQKEVSDCVIHVLEDEKNIQRIVLYYISKRELDAAALKETMKKRLPSYMIPDAFVWLEKFVYSANSKVDKKQLPVPDFSAYRTNAEVVEASNEYEKNLLAIWKSILNIPSAGITDNFFELGGNSLLVTVMHSEIQQLYPDILTVGDIFANPSIRDLAEAIRRLQDKKEHILQRMKLELVDDKEGSEMEFAYSFTEKEIYQLYDWCEQDGEQIKIFFIAVWEYLLSQIVQDTELCFQIREGKHKYYEYHSKKLEEAVFDDILEAVVQKTDRERKEHYYQSQEVQEGSVYHAFHTNEFTTAVCFNKITDAEENNFTEKVSVTEKKWIDKYMDLVFWLDIGQKKSSVCIYANRKEIADDRLELVYKLMVKTLKILLAE
ncbi:non-ribosomal peptide synthetase, partial [Anaeromicropila populeti]